VFEGFCCAASLANNPDSLLPGFEEYFRPQKQQLHDQWEPWLTAKNVPHHVRPGNPSSFDEVGSGLAALKTPWFACRNLPPFFRSTLRFPARW